ncbi:MAG: tRNA guanosine(34) transglycosylase Tgt [bacterium]|nr:tRNA guanosine(34) transglycosylase Tgt [bacterium]
MISFELLKQSSKSRARLGIIKTPHGDIETPAFVPVATQASIKTLSSEQTAQTNAQLLIANTFHLHLKPGEDIVAKHGGLHDFMRWNRPLMTDSGGFQVFSLGFGQDLGYGKIVRPETADTTREHIQTGDQPKYVRIEEGGVSFKSPLNGDWLHVGPAESIAIQEKLGADIMYSFDECTPPFATHDYVTTSLVRTHRWIKESLEARSGNQALYGIVQGSRFEDLRRMSARYNASLNFDGYGIGGDLGLSKEESLRILGWVIPELEQSKPRHLLGIGRWDDFKPIIEGGVDTFDCIVPTHYARHGTAFMVDGTRVNLKKADARDSTQVLEEGCFCATCQVGYTRGYLAHLLRAKETTGMSLVTTHNLFVFNAYVARLREKIKNDEL